jgi:membrane associated rhomboid family serine protease
MRSSPPPRRSYRRSLNLDFGVNPVMALIIANLILFVAVLVSPNQLFPYGSGQVISDRFTYYLGLIPHYFPSHPWTIVTAMFIHAGFWHIFGNMLTLFFFGSFLYRLIGGVKFLLVYFIGGIVGNALCLLLGNDLSLFIGASGAIYAIAGAMVVMVPKLPVRLYFLIPVPLWLVVLVFYGLWSIPGVGGSNIAWQAHLGGLVVGLIAGFLLRKRIRLDLYR